MVDAVFWSQQRVLLTGHTGFKGSWLSLWLARLGAQIFGVSLAPNTDPNLFDLLPSDIFLASKFVDIRNRTALKTVVEDANPTIVIHLAAQALVGRSYREPIETFETNVMGTANILELARLSPLLRAVLVVTTDKVYRNLEDGRAFCESDALGAHDPYSASKAAAEITTVAWAQSYFRDRGVPVVTARAGNVIGGGDWSEDRLVPDIWRAVRERNEPLLRHPNATRPWQHVLEPLSGYLSYLENISAGRANVPAALNFGPQPDDLLTVAELTEAMLGELGAPKRWQVGGGPKVSEMQSLALNSALATQTIGWRPRLSSREAIEWTAQWYGREALGKSAAELCLDQISRYESLP
ncbi:MAG TPA: CDP-glucose 4,6-dehydratase [Rhizomicrobium sp.]|jgi:CDP-glucose 4,6-dehydratase|nr:CDP-glucose 4,6-dehydratase [Rhizomicrobium sp.]